MVCLPGEFNDHQFNPTHINLIDQNYIQPKSNILLIANGTFSNVIHPFLFRVSNMLIL